ncbi:MAG: hypothetical protein WCD04_10235 [Terriglobia bacterium]
MKEFLERYLLPICASVFGTVVLLNPLKLSFDNRISLGVAVTALAYCIGRAIEKTPIAPEPGVRGRLSSVRLHKAASLLIAVVALGYLMASFVRRGPPAVEKLTSASPAASPMPAAHPATGSATATSVPASDRLGENNPAALPVSHVSPDSESARSDTPENADAEGAAEPSNPNRVEVLYEGPTAAGGVVSPKDAMAKELSDAGFEVLLTGSSASEEPSRKPGPSAQVLGPVAPAPPGPGPAAQPEPAVSRPPSGLTVKEIFDFVRKAQQAAQVGEPRPPGAFGFLPTPLFAATPAIRPQIVVAMRASMRRLREYQGIFSTQADMDIVAVTAHGKRIQSIVSMSGPGSVRGFGLDWEQAEQKALSEISSQMCPVFAKHLHEKLTGNK